jgi:hypothetical protein
MQDSVTVLINGTTPINGDTTIIPEYTNVGVDLCKAGTTMLTTRPNAVDCE